MRGSPYAEPDGIVAIYEKRVKEGNLRNTVSPPDFLDLREQSTSFQSMAATLNIRIIQRDAVIVRWLCFIESLRPQQITDFSCCHRHLPSLCGC